MLTEHGQPKPNSVITSKEFKAIRLRYRYTQQKFADLLGIGSWRTVSNYEMPGRNVPKTVAMLLQLLIETGKIV